MARTVLPLAGAIIGGIYGGPQGAQIGYAIGSLVGNAVDPITFNGPRVGEVRQQTSIDGATRTLLFGRGPLGGNIIATTPLQKVYREESQGKGSGPRENKEYLYQTMCLRLAEGGDHMLSATVLRIKANGKFIYDITPESAIQEESLEFSTKFRVYVGADDQLADPSLEAHFGVGTTCPHRGSLTVVFPDFDLTPYGGVWPQFEFDVATTIAALEYGEVQGPILLREAPMSEGNENTFVHVEVDNTVALFDVPSDVGARQPYRGQFGDNTPESFFETVEVDVPDFGLSSPTLLGAIPGGWALYWSGGGGQTYLYQNGILRSRLVLTVGGVESWYYNNFGAHPRWGNHIWFYEGSLYIGDSNRDDVHRFPIASAGGGELVRQQVAVDVSGNGSGIFSMHVDRSGLVWVSGNDGNLRCYDELLNLLSTTARNLSVWDNARAFAVENGLLYIFKGSSLVVADLATHTVQATHSLSGVENTTVSSRVMLSDQAVIIQNGNQVFWLERFQPEDSDQISLASVVAGLCDRVGIPSSRYDVSELNDTMLTGAPFNGLYPAREAIDSLRRAYFFDWLMADGKLRFVKRGRAIQGTITEDDLLYFPEDADKYMRRQGLEYPKVLHLDYMLTTNNYESIKARSFRESEDLSVTGEISLATAVVFEEPNEPERIADIHHRILETEAGGELEIVVGEDFIGATVTDCYNLTLRGRTRRVAIVEHRHINGEIHLKVRQDRLSDLESTAIAVVPPAPTPPPSNAIGTTTFIVANAPLIIDGDEAKLGVRAAAAGFAGTAWSGAQLQYSKDNGDSWVTLGDLGLAQIGALTAPLPASSPYILDRTNLLEATFQIDVSLDTLTLSQLLQERNGLLILNTDGTCEVLQYQDAEMVATRQWQLKTLARGRLNTAASSHAIGSKVCVLDSTVFFELPVSLLGKTLKFRAIPFGATEESAPTVDLVFNPAHSQYEFAPKLWSIETVIDGAQELVEGKFLTRGRVGTDLHPVHTSTLYEWQVIAPAVGGGEQILRLPPLTDGTFSFDAAGLTRPFNITFVGYNRITGLGEPLTISYDDGL